MPMSASISMTGVIAAFACTKMPIPASALAVLKLSLLDWSAVSLAGRDEPVSAIVQTMVRDEAGKGEASVIGQAALYPARAAALANGTISHALDYDDTHFSYVGHPSVVIFPAALAVAEKTGASGEAFMTAALIGMEAACRIGAWLGTVHYQHGFHQTATSGAFGATVSAGRLLGLDEERMRHALGIAATRASGLKSQFGTMGKPFNAGIAASNGVEAAVLAKAGFVSRPDGLECVQGFAETHAGETNDPAIVLRGLGEDFWFETVQHKFHACCHGLHASLEALAQLRTAPGFDVNAVEAIDLVINPRWLRVCDIKQPRTGLEAKFSYGLTSAMALHGRDTGALATYCDAVCGDPVLVALRDRVTVTGDPAVSDTQARVMLALRNGERRGGSFDLDALLPLAERQLKVSTKVHSLLGQNRAFQLESLVAELDTGSILDFAAQLRM
jgi:2-methylcitrate dehydratase PrpD